MSLPVPPLTLPSTVPTVYVCKDCHTKTDYRLIVKEGKTDWETELYCDQCQSRDPTKFKVHTLPDLSSLSIVPSPLPSSKPDILFGHEEDEEAEISHGSDYGGQDYEYYRGKHVLDR